MKSPQEKRRWALYEKSIAEVETQKGKMQMEEARPEEVQI